MRKPINGRESSVLALLVQSLNLSEKGKKRILTVLDGDALLVARAILGDINVPKWALVAANGFHKWVKSLKPIKKKT